jgi:hypothetical protein
MIAFVVFYNQKERDRKRVKAENREVEGLLAERQT